MVKRFITTAFVFAFTLVCLLPTHVLAEDTPKAGYPFSTIGISLEKLEEWQGKGEHRYDKNAQGKFLSGIVYKLDWSNVLGVTGELETEYVISKADDKDVVSGIILRFPSKTDKDQLINKISASLGTPTDQDKAHTMWYNNGISYDLQAFDTYIAMYINHAKFKNGTKYNLPEDMFVIAKQAADVNGDGKKEWVSILGKRFDDTSLYIENINILVESLDGKKGYVVSLSKYDGGYLPGLEFHDFTGNGIPEVMISMPTGGSGGITNYYIYSLKDDKPQLIFDSDKTSVKFYGEFIGNYKAKIYVEDPKDVMAITAIVDLKEKKAMYDELEIYKDGKLPDLDDIDTNVNELMTYQLYGLIKAVDTDDDGIMELEAYQSVKGCCNADTVAHIITLWKWEDGQWNLQRIAVEK